MNEILKKFNADGFCIINTNQKELITIINRKFDEVIKSGNYNTNSKIYSYNDKPRIVDAYKLIPEIKDFAKSEQFRHVFNTLGFQDMLPFSNILFSYGSEQPLHSDYVHHGTLPELLLVGVWTALEDIQENSGELIVVPGSHKLDIFRYVDLGLKRPKSLPEIKKNYSKYEEYVKKIINENNLSVVKLHLKKGESVIWNANLLHGGAKINNGNKTRRSFVIHYTFVNADKFYNPSFSFFKNPTDYNLKNLEFF